MEPTFEVLSSGVLPLERYAEVMNRTFPQVLETAARGVVRRAISITPPASASGVEGGLDTGGEAKLRGYRTISRDLNKLFVPVKLKHRRKEAISGTEMVRIHARALSYKRPGAAMRRDRGQPYYVDARKFNALEMKLRSHVGRLASGWVAAAQAIKAAVPAWISRHGSSRGSVQMDFDSNELYFEAVNTAPGVPAYISAEAQKRIAYATQYQAKAMMKGMQGFLDRRARECGFQVD